jgi:hypothetical protein
MPYNFYSEDEQTNGKYFKGDEIVKISDIEDLSLVSAFDYISLDKSDFCFNNSKIEASDFTKLFEFKKEISKIKIKNFFDDTDIKKKYHFHDVNLYEKKFLIDKLKNLLGYNKFIELYELPTIYQIAVYTSEKKAPRILGFFGRNATFHLLWFDYEHKIYPNKKH